MAPAAAISINALAAVLRLKVHPAAAVGNDVDRVAERQSIQHGELNAVISGEAENGQLHDPLTTQPAVQFGFLPVTVVKKSAVAVDDPVLPFVEHGGDRLLLEQRMQRRAFAVLHAVIRPESLRQAVQSPTV